MKNKMEPINWILKSNNNGARQCTDVFAVLLFFVEENEKWKKKLRYFRLFVVDGNRVEKRFCRSKCGRSGKKTHKWGEDKQIKRFWAIASEEKYKVYKTLFYVVPLYKSRPDGKCEIACEEERDGERVETYSSTKKSMKQWKT